MQALSKLGAHPFVTVEFHFWGSENGCNLQSGQEIKEDYFYVYVVSLYG